MSTAVRLFLASFGFLIVIVSVWLVRAGRQRLSINGLSRSGIALSKRGISFGLATLFLGIAIVLLTTIRVDNWSAVDWAFGLCAAGALYFAGGMAGALVGTEIGEKEAVGKARPPIESNGARA